MKCKVIPSLLAFAMMVLLLPLNTYAVLPVGVPEILARPSIKKVELLTKNVKKPIFQLEIGLPQSALDLDVIRPAAGITNIEIYCKIDNGEWLITAGGYMDNMIHEPTFKVPGKANTFYTEVYAFDKDGSTAVDLEKHKYYFKAQLHYFYYLDKNSNDYAYIYSAFSNEISIGVGGTPVKTNEYSSASTWAIPEIQKASDFALIPDILKGSDMTKPINREEFCELVVLLYEKITKTTAEAVSPNTFIDTANAQILKAYKLGITSGMSATTFLPKKLISREECASMLFSAIKAMKPDDDYSTAGVKDFPDKKYISSWAVEATKYMSKTGIISGDSKGNFMPKATAGKAAGYGMATREQAVAIIVRTFNKMINLTAKSSMTASPNTAEPANTSSMPMHASQAKLKLPAAFPNEIPFTGDAVIQQIVDDSKAAGSQSITLAYASKKPLSEIKSLYLNFMKNATDIVEQDIGDMYILTGNINKYELTMVYLNGQINLNVTPDRDKF